MTSLMEEIIGGGSGAGKSPLFPNAPAGWTPALAVESARREGLELADARESAPGEYVFHIRKR